MGQPAVNEQPSWRVSLAQAGCGWCAEPDRPRSQPAGTAKASQRRAQVSRAHKHSVRCTTPAAGGWLARAWHPSEGIDPDQRAEGAVSEYGGERESFLALLHRGRLSSAVGWSLGDRDLLGLLVAAGLLVIKERSGRQISLLTKDGSSEMQQRHGMRRVDAPRPRSAT